MACSSYTDRPVLPLKSGFAVQAAFSVLPEKFNSQLGVRRFTNWHNRYGLTAMREEIG
jgi:hypothetical protein